MHEAEGAGRAPRILASMVSAGLAAGMPMDPQVTLEARSLYRSGLRENDRRRRDCVVEEMLAGGYRKKYLRAVSRLIALTNATE